MRVEVQAVSILPLALLAAACGGGDLTLPSDATPAALRIVAGDGQSATEGSPVSDPLVVRLEDGLGHPVVGGQVEFRFVGELPGAAVDPGSAPTDGRGQATVHARLGQREGPQLIEALVAVPGEDLRVHFQLTALAVDDPGGGNPGGPETSPPPPPSGGDDGGGGGQTGGGAGGSGSGGGHDGGGHGGGHDNGHGNGHGHDKD
jgi:hypothetical protein